MGLDNGVCVKMYFTNGFNPIPLVLLHNCERSYLEYEEVEDENEIPCCDKTRPLLWLEMVYWRKWWGVRDAVIDNLHNKYKGGLGARIVLDSEDIEMIIDQLEYYNNAKTWAEEEASPIWDYNEDGIQDQIDIDICVLKELAKFMRSTEYRELLRSGAIEVYFYDSY